MNYEELQKQYKRVPDELKKLKRWVCFRVENKDGENRKMPINALFGSYAKCNDKMTWTNFQLALNGCVKYNCDGLGFMLGDGIFGVDLDDGAWKSLKKGVITEDEYEIAKKEFDEVCDEIVKGLNSYTERSISKKGLHIICYGTLPNGRRRSGNFEMYDSGRFFAFTGDVINNVPIQERTSEIKPLWEKFINNGKPMTQPISIEQCSKPDFELEDEEIIEKIRKSSQAQKFEDLYNGFMGEFNDDHSAADQAFCNILAFWTANNFEQIDRIFRNSALMRDKWDQKRGEHTYGERTIMTAISMTSEVYKPRFIAPELPAFLATKKKPNVSAKKYMDEETGELINDFIPNMSIDEDGEPIFKKKIIYKRYHLDDTGNANKFYDYFGEYFKYNVTDKTFMYWTGKTWIVDEKDIIKKYANMLIEISRDEIPSIEENIENYTKEGKTVEAEIEEEYLKAFRKNLTRMSNKAGKEAMISEFKVLKQISAKSDEFNNDKLLLNTDSGIVNLATGDLQPFNYDAMMSKNTNCKVVNEQPQVWLQFLESIFYRGDEPSKKEETKQIIHFIKKALGYSLTADCSEQGLFLLYGDGSNGKSTFVEQISYMMGDYADSVSSSVLMRQKTQNDSTRFTLAKLKNIRFVAASETEDGEQLAEAQVKNFTGGEKISAQFKFGNEFSYVPEFKVWLSTNNLPIIRGNDYGIWRRIYAIPFLRRFTDDEKDKSLPQRLREETPKILAWCIEGYQEYLKDNGLNLPECLKKVRTDYKNQMDVVSKFLEDRTIKQAGFRTNARTLFQNYKMWAQDNLEFSLKQSKFETQLIAKGYPVEKRGGEKVYVGVRLLNDQSYNFGGDED